MGEECDKNGNYIQNHLIQIKTGEGKSITLGIASVTLALLGADVYCGCYSKHLSVRDEIAFRPLFKVLDVERHIEYGTLERLCETIINERGELRESILNKVQNKSDRDKKIMSKRKKVLLIDEVDVFFDKDFYGNFYAPVAILKNENVQAIIKQIWEQRESFKSLKDYQTSPEYSKCK